MVGWVACVKLNRVPGGNFQTSQHKKLGSALPRLREVGNQNNSGEKEVKGD